MRWWRCERRERMAREDGGRPRGRRGRERRPKRREITRVTDRGYCYGRQGRQRRATSRESVTKASCRNFYLVATMLSALRTTRVAATRLASATGVGGAKRSMGTAQSFVSSAIREGNATRRGGQVSAVFYWVAGYRFYCHYQRFVPGSDDAT